MSVKVKMRCARCGKSFKSSGAKQTLCDTCEAKARQERITSKTATPKSASPAPAPAQAPKIVGPGASILVPGLVAPSTSVPPESGTFGRHQHQHQHERGAAGTHTDERGHSGHAPQSSHPSPPGASAAAPGGRKPGQGTPVAHEKQPQRPVRQEAQKQPPKAPREPKPPRTAPPAIELTDEVRQKIEARYLELANPVEFDGIRTQIAGELSVPKALVKKAVLELRARMQMPSWWELQSYTGGVSDLERIRRAYIPHLPVPEIGIHKTLATELGLEPSVVYQAIKRIRGEMRLPRYNPPETHAGEKAESAGEQPNTAAEVSIGAQGA